MKGNGKGKGKGEWERNGEEKRREGREWEGRGGEGKRQGKAKRVGGREGGLEGGKEEKRKIYKLKFASLFVLRYKIKCNIAFDGVPHACSLRVTDVSEILQKK